jgi:hypothetical protein
MSARSIARHALPSQASQLTGRARHQFRTAVAKLNSGSALETALDDLRTRTSRTRTKRSKLLTTRLRRTPLNWATISPLASDQHEDLHLRIDRRFRVKRGRTHFDVCALQTLSRKPSSDVSQKILAIQRTDELQCRKRRKPQRYPPVSRGFSPWSGARRHGSVHTSLCDTTLGAPLPSPFHSALTMAAHVPRAFALLRTGDTTVALSRRAVDGAVADDCSRCLTPCLRMSGGSAADEHSRGQNDPCQKLLHGSSKVTPRSRFGVT